jgi:hypothetical protein
VTDPNKALAALIYDRLGDTLEHAQLRQHVAEIAAGVVSDFGTWPIIDGDLAIEDRLVNPHAYDATYTVCAEFGRYDTAKTRSEAASALDALANAISDLTSFLSAEDREALDWGGEDPKDRAREIAAHAKTRSNQ